VPLDSPAHLTPLLVSKLAAQQDANPIPKHMPERVLVPPATQHESAQKHFQSNPEIGSHYYSTIP
jgi:hypothetical protein